MHFYLAFAVFLSGVSLLSQAHAAEPFLQVILESGGSRKTIKTWTAEELKSLKRVASRETDPVTNEPAQWEGVGMNDLIEASWGPLSPTERAGVDLVVLQNEKGVFNKRADIPRSLVTRFDVILALKKDGQDIGGRGPIVSVIPWTSKPELQGERLPLASYFVPAVSTILLTNVKALYGAKLFLPQQGNPLKIRGQKRFVQNCMGCHRWTELPKGPALSKSVESRELFSAIHTTVKGIPPLDDLDQRGLQVYLRAIQTAPGASFFERFEKRAKNGANSEISITSKNDG